jgi:hypothetical protein
MRNATLISFRERHSEEAHTNCPRQLISRRYCPLYSSPLKIAEAASKTESLIASLSSLQTNNKRDMQEVPSFKGFLTPDMQEIPAKWA